MSHALRFMIGLAVALVPMTASAATCTPQLGQTFIDQGRSRDAVREFCCFSAFCVCVDDDCTSRVCSDTPSFARTSTPSDVCAEPSAS